MARWDHGYITDVAYTTNAYHEASPCWLATCARLLGFRTPDLAAPFRYADLGCGNGLGVLIAAATNPHADFYGCDFNPSHIENARALAAQAKLTNVRFEEVSFEELAKGGGSAGEDFDFLVAHGVLSWVSLENRLYLTTAIGRLLRPGGLAMVSYNTTPGWSGVEPIRLLMRQLVEADHRRTDLAAVDTFRVLDQLRTGGAAFFRAQPGLEARLAQMRTMDPRYIAHEFLNRDWHPVMFAEVAESMVETKMTYIGSATLMENLDVVSVQEAILPLLNATPDLATRETIRDLAIAKTFRRDLWRKGSEPMLVPEHMVALDALTLAWTGKAVEAEVTFPGPLGTITGQAEFYHPVIEALRHGPVTLAELRTLPVLQNRQMAEFIQAAMLLLGGGFAYAVSPHGTRPEVRESARRLNGAIVNRLRVGVDVRRLAAPLNGSFLDVDVIEALVIGRLLDGGSHDPEGLIDAVLNDVLRSGRSLLRDGQPLQEPGAARVLIGETVRVVLERRFQLLRDMGMIG
jgi:SAM-dependent methyltransferase